MARKKNQKSVNETPIRCMALAHGAIKTAVKGTKKGKRGYTRKNKHKGKAWA
jgi:hypothetical protein